jgi:hypothetical protein
MDLLKSMVAKLDERSERQKGGDEGTKLLEELFQLKHEVTSLKREKESEKENPIIANMVETVTEHKGQIRELEQVRVWRRRKLRRAPQRRWNFRRNTMNSKNCSKLRSSRTTASTQRTNSCGKS